jgi:hypothetical protein
MLQPLRSYDVHIVYFNYDGERKEKILNSAKEVKTFKENLKKNRRKYCGRRKLRLFETRESQID